MRAEQLLVATCFISCQLAGVIGHGRLMDPPARNSMWRFGFPNTIDYNDNALYCGGYDVQHKRNGGRCGLCGDPFHEGNPRPHEAGGTYAKGIISRQYRVGQEIDVEVELTANHWGRFELHLCPNNNPKSEATESCLERYPLYLSRSKDVAYHLSTANRKSGIFRYKVRLPPYVTCTQCVLRWNYYTGHLWGTCANGTEGLGCAPPETFKNCADVSIVAGEPTPTDMSSLEQNEVNPQTTLKPSTTTYRTPQYTKRNQSRPTRPYRPVTTTTSRTTTTLRTTSRRTTQFGLGPYQYAPFRPNSPPAQLMKPIRRQVCKATPLFSRLYGANEWCQQRCVSFNPHCPPDMCYCPDSCDPVGELVGVEGADSFCAGVCIVYPASSCPEHRCSCTNSEVKENEVNPSPQYSNNYGNQYQPYLPNFYPYYYKK